MLVTLFILFTGWILYLLMKPIEETDLPAYMSENDPPQVEIASLHHERKVIEIENISSETDKNEARERE
ncbi:hypothetical protein [Pseudalkalibacillus salsuginis]|uniref:hypothetical protein n=1 Tax=Pseudalkalibacillus salsuginis TaxID=2910972 RepID=UPI001F34BEBD|nr:hypothetical protein [Pseudalkalibacillus salsuginis]MCF6409418.1 hypothetical protein [Pseudalkalibacillus salsuginis]